MIVVDASVALAWVLDESEVNHQYAADVAAAKLEGDEELIAPMLMAQECSYRLLKIGRTKRWGGALVAEYGETIDMIGVRYLDQLSTVSGLVRFAVRRHVQGYDAVYLALALATGAKLATLDGGLKTAARAAGVELFSA
ncbi:type II toxin-antitoxin system VapC family toxin [Roseateles sp.]|uniref:type II toxin-antitoxin system VapC family toxin n=1 Tax=Roseateles sp. TaxID=1971397 RepID=UPI002E01F233|nr:type II toxin-antitoxin system VapC family toxin [Roseateles sp.]